jgi:hypothetical protein
MMKLPHSTAFGRGWWWVGLAVGVAALRALSRKASFRRSAFADTEPMWRID